MKLKMVIATLVCGMAFCSNSYGFELLDRMMGRAGCDGCATSCCDTPVNAGCGCDAETNCCDGGCGIRCHKFGNFFNRGCGGCGLFSGGCCGTVDAGCGCNGGHAGCFRGCGLFNRGCCGAVDAGCGCNGGNVGAGCGCDNGCDSGCCGRVGCFTGFGLFNRGCCGAVDAGCGCNGGNVGAGCGCDNGCDSGCCGNGCGLLDRIRARHASRHCGGCCGAVVSPNCGCNGATGDAPQVVEPPADAPVADPNAFIVPNRRIAGGAR